MVEQLYSLPQTLIKIEGLLEMIGAKDVMINGPVTTNQITKLVATTHYSPVNKKELQEKFSPLAKKLRDV